MPASAPPESAELRADPLESEFIHHAFWRRDSRSALKNGDICPNPRLLKNLEKSKGTGIDPEIDKLWVAMKVNGKFVNRFGAKKADVGVEIGDIGCVINGGVLCGKVTLKLVRPKGVLPAVTLFTPRNMAGMVEPNCIGRDTAGPMRMGIEPAGRTIGLVIVPIGRIIIGRGLWAMTGVLVAPSRLTTVNGIHNSYLKRGTQLVITSSSGKYARNELRTKLPKLIVVMANTDGVDVDRCKTSRRSRDSTC